jgi:hypothetical protein
MMKNDSSIQQQYDRLLQEKKSLTERINTQNQTLSKLRELNKSITERIQREKKFFQEQLQNKTFKKKDDFKKDLSNFRKQKESIVKIYYEKRIYDRQGRPHNVLMEMEVPKSQSKKLQNSVMDKINNMEQKWKESQSFLSSKQQQHTR